jgi:hypothetical protein
MPKSSARHVVVGRYSDLEREEGEATDTSLWRASQPTAERRPRSSYKRSAEGRVRRGNNTQRVSGAASDERDRERERVCVLVEVSWRGRVVTAEPLSKAAAKPDDKAR